MCTEEHGDPVEHDRVHHDAALAGTHEPRETGRPGTQLTRRNVLRAAAGLAVAVPLARAGLDHWSRPGMDVRWTSAPSPATLTGQRPITAAMHVHGGWSEGTGSWDAQFAQAASLGIDLLYMTDHDFRAQAYGYLDSLDGVPLDILHTGELAQQAVHETGGTMRVLAESADAAPASVSASVENRAASVALRTSIAGTRLRLAFGHVRLDPGATFELRVVLSIHTASGTRPAGQLDLRRVWGRPAARFLVAEGLAGVVSSPAPASGSVEVVDLVAEVQALWPDVLANDNCLYQLQLVATSPSRGVVADVSQSLTFLRSEIDEESVLAHQREVLETYGPRHPEMSVWPSVEISRLHAQPHVIPFGVKQWFPDQRDITEASATRWFREMVESVHHQGGVASWNHPFGTPPGGRLRPQVDLDHSRRTIFQQMRGTDAYGTDLLEVGYTLRGHAGTQAHLDLWDTFSRHGRFFTGTGVSDDHDGVGWASLENGFATGVWAESVAQPDVVAALSAGRAYSFHVGRWPGGQLDMQVDETVRMGQVSVSDARTRPLVLTVEHLPQGAVVEVVCGVVDHTGIDPSTSVTHSIPVRREGASVRATVPVDTGASCFVRAQVRRADGAIIGIGNPIWLLREHLRRALPTGRDADRS